MPQKRQAVVVAQRQKVVAVLTSPSMLKNISLLTFCQACEETHNVLPENIMNIYTDKFLCAPVCDVIRICNLSCQIRHGCVRERFSMRLRSNGTVLSQLATLCADLQTLWRAQMSRYYVSQPKGGIKSV